MHEMKKPTHQFKVEVPRERYKAFIDAFEDENDIDAMIADAMALWIALVNPREMVEDFEDETHGVLLEG